MQEQSPNAGNEHPAPMNFMQLKNQLYPRLAGYSDNYDAKEAAELLMTLAGHRLMIKPCIKQVRAELIEAGSDQAQTVNKQFCNQVRSSYPAGSGETPELMSPNRFIQENGLDGRLRPELRDAQARAVTASKNGLIAAVKEDEINEKITEKVAPGVSNEELEAEIAAETTARMHAALDCAEKIIALTYIREVPVYTDRLGSQALRGMSSANFIITAPALAVPASGKQRAQLDGAIYSFKSTLKDLLNGETVVARTVAERYEAQIRDYVTCKLISRYEELEGAALATLPAEVEAAYIEAARLGPQYKPRSKPNAPKDKSNEKPDASTTPETLPTDSSETQTVQLGELDSPFPWAPESTVSVSLIRDNDHSLVFCEAMPPVAQSISRQLRTQKQYGEEFSRAWELVCQVEASGQAASYKNIQKVQHVDDVRYQDLTLFSYGKISPNARRTYYGKTSTGTYPAIAELTSAQNLPSDAPLLVLIAETDKANQLRIFNEFGIDRRSARAGGAGSI